MYTFKFKIVLMVMILSFLPVRPLSAATWETKGELSEWLILSDNALKDEARLGMRYIPELSLTGSPAGSYKLDGLASVNASFEAPTDDFRINDERGSAKFHRLWGRWSTDQFEARLGLQKINFGPAKLLRSLIWFDTLDPRDPLKFTEGVKALLLRYYFLDNTNIWLWGLYGNDDLRGVDRFTSDEKSPEAGCRIQTPVGPGEMALTVHHRKVDKEDWQKKMLIPLEDGSEDRVALDGVWDVGIGLWFEAAASRTIINSNSNLWGNLFTVGGDYTLDTGLHITAEHFNMWVGPAHDKTETINSISAISADYGIGLLDRINGIAYYNWEEEESFGLAGWQRTYDDWIINIVGFTGPEGDIGNFSGNGVQLIVTYNH